MAGLPPPSDGPPLIPLPAPSAARTSNSTPILKWILSRPNTHLLPLHLLTTGGTLSALVDRKAFSPGDVPARRFQANAGNGTASEEEKKKRADDVSDEKRAPTVSPFFSPLPPHHPMHALSHHSLLGQQPADAMPQPQAWLKEERAALSPLGLHLLLQPVAACEQQLLQPVAACEQQLLLRPLQAARRDLAHDLRDRYDDADVVEYEEEQRQWRHFTPVLPPSSPATAAGAWLTGIVKEEGGVIRKGDVMDDDVIIGNDDDDRMTDDIDVVGYDQEEEPQRRAYSPALPPSPPAAALLTGVAKREASEEDVVEREKAMREMSVLPSSPPDAALLTGVAKREVEQADDVGERKTAMSQPARRSAVLRKRPAAERPEVIYCKQYLGMSWLQEQRRDRLVLTPQQRDLCSAIMARVSYLLPAERELLAGAIGITQRQVLNVFTNRGGRATQRRAGGPSTEEAQRVIREELLNHGYVFNDVDDSVKKD